MYCQKAIFLLALPCLLLLTTCKREKSPPDKKVTTTEISEKTLSTAPPLTAQRQFYYAWLADCVNEQEYNTDSQADAIQHLEGLAKGRIADLIKNPAVTNVWGQDSLVWGPVLRVNDIGDGDYVADNLIYCVLSQDASSGEKTFSIGIAGTDMVSPFDWFTEDFEINEPSPWAYGGGNISMGADTAFTRINNLVDPILKQNLETYLQNALRGNPNATITVAGHSLGGTITQVYASYLREALNNGGTDIEAYAFAGPTAGDVQFANNLTTKLTYTAYNNKNGMVPRLWQADSLKQLCELYDGVAIYDGIFGTQKIDNDVTLQGVINFLREDSKTASYADPGLPNNRHQFDMGTKNYGLSWDELGAMNAILEVYWHGGDENDMYPPLNNITKMCNGGTKISEDEFFNIFYYLAEAGIQHTTAYSDYFFMDRDDAFKAAVKAAVPGGEGWFNWFDNGSESQDILETFFAKISAYYTSQQACSCNEAI